jgi:fatty acid amide hydrolase 2
MPAFFNGVFGHKPTGGLVPGTGQFPIAMPAAHRYLCTGPLTRRAEDLMPLLRLIAGDDGVDKGIRPISLGDPASVRLEELEVLVVYGNGRQKVSRELLEAQRKAADFLANSGARVREVQFDKLRYSLELWSSMLGSAQDGLSFRSMMGRPKMTQLLWQCVLWCFRASPHTLPALVLGVLEELEKLLPGHMEKMCRLGEELRQELHEAMGDNGVLLYPPYVSVAPRHYKPLLPPFNWVYTAILNVMQFPVTQVPLGLNPKGLPLGVQVVGLDGMDHRTIAVALALEQEFGGWQFPEQL